MENCERTPGCPFFNNNLENMPETAEKMKDIYCRGNKNLCARYKIARVLGPEKVLKHLFPNMADTAELILQEAR